MHLMSLGYRMPNYAKTSGYDADGMLSWQNATAWADSLSYHDNVRNVS